MTERAALIRNHDDSTFDARIRFRVQPTSERQASMAVVIPAYRVADRIAGVKERTGRDAPSVMT